MALAFDTKHLWCASGQFSHILDQRASVKHQEGAQCADLTALLPVGRRCLPVRHKLACMRQHALMAIPHSPDTVYTANQHLQCCRLFDASGDQQKPFMSLKWMAMHVSACTEDETVCILEHNAWKLIHDHKYATDIDLDHAYAYLQITDASADAVRRRLKGKIWQIALRVVHSTLALHCVTCGQ